MAEMLAPRRLRRPWRLGRVGIVQVVVWEAVGLAAVVGLAAWTGGWVQGGTHLALLAGAGAVLLMALGVTATWRGHYWAYEWAVVRSRHDERRPDDDPDPAPAPAPDVTMRAFVDRAGTRHAMVRRGRCWVVLLELRADVAAPGRTQSTALVAEAVAGAVAQGDARLTGYQLVTLTAPRSGVLDADTPGAGVPARRATWLALQFDPVRCAGAVLARGGGVSGAHRALASIAARVAIRLRAHGLEVRVVADDGLRSALRQCLGPVEGPAYESWTGWHVGGVRHTTYWVVRWPRQRDDESYHGFLGALATLPSLATVVSTTITLRDDGGGPWVRTLVRYLDASPSDDAADSGDPDVDDLDRRVAALAERWRAGVSRLDGEHRPAAWATLPLGEGPVPSR